MSNVTSTQQLIKEPIDQDNIKHGELQIILLCFVLLFKNNYNLYIIG